MSNFQDESLNMKIILRAKRQKQKDAMFSLSRRSIFNNSELGSQTYEIIGFFPARMRNIAQLIRWMEFLSQKNRLSNWSGARHSRAFWELSRAWKWLRFHSELGRIVRKTRTSERIVEMSGIARLTKSNCFSRTGACMKGSCASNKSLKNARECFAPPSHLRLESERHKFRDVLKSRERWENEIASQS